MNDLINPALVAAVVTDSLLHDGVQFVPGDDIELAPADFDKLVAAGVVIARNGPAAVAQAEPKPTAEDLALLVKDAIARLEPSDFDGEGAPKLAAVQKAMPEGTKGVTKALVASVWASLKQTP